MGCASSREARRDRQWSQTKYFRTHSMPVHGGGGSTRKVVDSNRGHHHIVALKSSTLGSIRLDDEDNAAFSDDDEAMMKADHDKGAAAAIDQAKAWSEMIETKMPKRSQAKTPAPAAADSDEPETINAWELMEGLEEPAAAAGRHSRPSLSERSISFSNGVAPPLHETTNSAAADTAASEEDPISLDFDPDILSNFRKALDEMSPQHQSLLRSPSPARRSVTSSKDHQHDPPKATGIVKARVTAFQQKIDAKRSKKSPPNGERRVVLYSTSLRGIRKTYEDCWAVRVILQGYGVKVDERDVSMHAGFKDELNAILGAGFGGNRLPRVFANGKYLGGAEEVTAMHEAGELGKALEECEALVVGKGGGACERCGGVRFVPCETCSGSCKVFVEEETEDGEEAIEEVAGGFRRCPECNENGLIRCPYCL